MNDERRLIIALAAMAVAMAILVWMIGPWRAALGMSAAALWCAATMGIRRGGNV